MRRLFRPLREPLHETRWLLALTLTAGWAKFFLPLVIPWSVGRIIDEVLTEPDRAVAMSRLAGIATWCALAICGASIANYFRSTSGQVMAARVQHTLRQRLFHHIQRLNMEFFQRHHAGALGARLTSDISAAGGLIEKGLVHYGLDGVFFAVMSVVLLTVDWRLTAVAYAILLANALVINRVKPLLRQQQKEVKESQSAITGQACEVFASISLVKAYAGESETGDAFDERSIHVRGLQQRTSRLQGFFQAVSNGMIQSTTLAVIAVGAWLILRDPEAMSKGTLIAFMLYLGQINGTIQRMMDNLLTLQEGFAGLERICELLAVSPTPADAPHATSPRISGRIELRDVSFGYGRRLVLEHLDVVFEHGRTYALVGPSGSGKSSLCQLLLRFYDPQSGAVLVDGHDLRDIRQAHWRANTAVVLQDPVLFSTSIADNIAFAAGERSPEEIIAAAKRAQAHDFIADLPDGYATRLGERGVNLSGGQRQRIAIARALMRDPRLLILDEATSALDTVTEHAIQRVIDDLRRTRTVIVIAHRISTIRSVDEIIVLDEGRVVQRGSYGELVQVPGLFARLAAGQEHAA
ncbi:MAG TPA: ABC transporter ATP-binding protein [Planctomycetota bacterium]|nr:ABC transporter ATP-binding protein [Planctomycetota bacterium]